MRRRDFLTAAVGAVGALAMPRYVEATASSAKRPNIVVIVADDLGFGDLSSFGASDLRTPHIDRIAEQGMRFNHFYANCPVCSPTRAALFTGRYPDLVGVPGVIRTAANNSWGYLSPQAVLLPQVLKEAGYATALMGKWHLGLEEPNLPNRRGFDLFHGFLGDMMEDYYTHRRVGQNYMRLNDQVIDPRGHATDLFTDWACEYIAQQAGKGPFFLYLAYNAPHDPIQPPQEYLDRVKQRSPQTPDRRARLVALIEHLDAGVGKVMEALAKAGTADDTLVFFVSDNGGNLNMGATNGQHRAGKATVYEGGLRVPAMARWPGHIKAGSRCDRVALTMDIMPTAVAAAGASVTHEIDGRSILPEMLGQERTWKARDLFFREREGGTMKGGTIEAMRRGDWKLVRSRPGAPWELYNLADDPMESKNLANAQPEKLKELVAAMEAQLAKYDRVPWKKPQ